MADPLLLNIGVALAILVAGISTMLVLVSLLAYRRMGNLRLLFAGGAFAVLLVKGVLAATRIIRDREVDFITILLDALVMGFLYVSVAKR